MRQSVNQLGGVRVAAQRNVNVPVKLRPVLVAAAVFIALIITLLPIQASSAEVSFETWAAVAEEMNTQLTDGLNAYKSGNTSGAAADVKSAYNSVYVGANFSTVVRDTISADVQSSQQQQFRSLQELAYTTGNEDAFASQVAALTQELTDTATQLDANADLAAPDAYAKAQDEKIAQDRAKLDAAKKKNEGKGTRAWSQIASEMSDILDSAVAAYEQGDGSKGASLVNEAYYQYYEKLGFEKNVMNAISGNRVSQVEYQFKESRQAMNNGEPLAQAKQYIEDLKAMLAQDAQELDGGAAGNVNPLVSFATSAFGQAFLILLREGLEAVLVVAAIIAYLLKTGNKRMLKYIYLGVVAGLLASGVVAALFVWLFNGSSSQQEIFEGVVALIAMVMLLYTSNWMLSRSSITAWNSYIKNQTAAAVSRGGVLSLALLSFLAVFREGAETVMFYQAIFAMTSGSTAGIWGGFISAAVLLVIIFLLIRFTSVKIPIRPFFLVTSALMSLLVIVFAGGGVHALIEGDVVNGTYVNGVPTNDWIGLYPYAETIAAQIIAAIAVVVLMTVSLVKQSREAKRSVAAQAEQDSKHSQQLEAAAAGKDAIEPISDAAGDPQRSEAGASESQSTVSDARQTSE